MLSTGHECKCCFFNFKSTMLLVFFYFRDISTFMECLANETSGCSSIQLYPIQYELRYIINANNLSCETTELMIEDAFTPLYQCYDAFVEDFTAGLTECYLPYGDSVDLCNAAEGFKLCVYKIPNLPTKTFVSEMVEMTSGLYSGICVVESEGMVTRIYL